MCHDYPEFLHAEWKRRLNSGNIPATLREYMPLAELWGITDDRERKHLVERAPDVAKRHLAAAIEEIDDILDEWLAGPEADSSSPTLEYLAFSALRMAADAL